MKIWVRDKKKYKRLDFLDFLDFLDLVEHSFTKQHGTKRLYCVTFKQHMADF